MEMESRPPSPDPDLLVGRARLDEIRAQLTETFDEDTIAVIVLAGTPERGLGLSVSSATDERETFRLLVHALQEEAVDQGWIDDEEQTS